MDWFEILFFFIFASGFMAVQKLHFFISLVGAKHKISYYAIYLAFTYLAEMVNRRTHSYWFATIFTMLFLVGLGYLLMKTDFSNAVLAAILADSVLQLTSGIVYSFCCILSPFLIPLHPALGIYIGIGSLLLSLLLAHYVYRFILQRFHLNRSATKRYFAIFFLPILCVLLVCGYISGTFYGNLIVMDSSGVIQPGVNHWVMLSIQCVVGALLCSTLYACQKLSDGFEAQTRLALLEQEVTTQQDYLQEAHARYEQTQAFRHDIKGHLSALGGLLEQGETQKAIGYLEKLDAISETLSFPCKTGNTVVDTLLSAKLGVARQNGIRVECTVKIPSPCAVDDLDLCILFSNAVDNAVRACIAQPTGERYIWISGKEKGAFFMIEVENSCADVAGYQKGIGLANIEAVAEKYTGAVTAENRGGFFRLNILLVISRSLDDISV